MSVSRSNELSVLAGLPGGFAPLDSGLLVPSSYLPHGTSFPAGPATYQRHFRDDLGMEFYYDGTRWVSQLLRATGKFSENLAATGEAARHAIQPPLGTDLWLVSWSVTFIIASGGSALSASHKWVIGATKYGGASNTGVTGTLNIDSGASNEWRTNTVTIGELLGSYYLISSSGTKTGTPGNLYYYATLNYRIVAT